MSSSFGMLPPNSIAGENMLMTVLYRQAQRADQEYQPSAFWQVFLQRQFYENEYIVVCEAAPTSGSSRRVDIVVRRFDAGNLQLSSFVFVECKSKRGSKSESRKQTLTAAQAAFSNDSIKTVFVMSTVGTQFYVGYVDHRDMKKIHPIPNNAFAHQGQFSANHMAGVDGNTYLDAGSPYSWCLLSAIAYIKSNVPEHVEQVLSSNATPADLSHSSAYYSAGGQAQEELYDEEDSDEARARTIEAYFAKRSGAKYVRAVLSHSRHTVLVSDRKGKKIDETPVDKWQLVRSESVEGYFFYKGKKPIYVTDKLRTN